MYIDALAPNTFIINNFYILSIYFYGTPFIFLPPLPQNIYALFYENICNNGYGGICLYIYIRIFVMIYKFQKKNVCLKMVQKSHYWDHMYICKGILYPSP